MLYGRWSARGWVTLGLVLVGGCATGPRSGGSASPQSVADGASREWPEWVHVPSWSRMSSERDDGGDGAALPAMRLALYVCDGVDGRAADAIPADGRYVVLADDAAGRFLDAVRSGDDAQMLSSPVMTVTTAREARCSVLDAGSGGARAGVVFFAKPLAIDRTGAEFVFSYQAGRAVDDGDEGADAVDAGSMETERLDGRAKLAVGQWYAHRLGGESRAGARVLLIHLSAIVRADPAGVGDGDASAVGGAAG